MASHDYYQASYAISSWATHQIVIQNMDRLLRRFNIEEDDLVFKICARPGVTLDLSNQRLASFRKKPLESLYRLEADGPLSDVDFFLKTYLESRPCVRDHVFMMRADTRYDAFESRKDDFIEVDLIEYRAKPYPNGVVDELCDFAEIYMVLIDKQAQVFLKAHKVHDDFEKEGLVRDHDQMFHQKVSNLEKVHFYPYGATHFLNTFYKDFYRVYGEQEAREAIRFLFSFVNWT